MIKCLEIPLISAYNTVDIVKRKNGGGGTDVEIEDRREACGEGPGEQTEALKDEVYRKAIAKMRGVKNAGMQQEAIDLLKTIPGFLDADERIAVCEQRIRELKEKENVERTETKQKTKRRNQSVAIVLSSAIACAACVILLFTVILPAIRYGKAKKLYQARNYEEAIAAFESMNGYGDSETKILECRYGIAEDLYAAGEYEAAADAFSDLNGYRDSAEKAKESKAAFTEQQYESALTLSSAGKYDEAYPILIALDGYRDSERLASGMYEDYKAARLCNAKVGDYVLFGAYEQDNDLSDGNEDVEWLVLAKDDDGILVISRYVLDYMQYSSSTENASWDTCSLRKWLNGTFLDSAFSEDEQLRIRDVIGKVFLLSTSDAYKYMDTDEARRCVPTAYAIAKGAITSNTYRVDGKDTCGWWLRTPYSSNWHAAVITIDGAVSTLDVDLWLVYYGVRPALWIDTGVE